MWRPSPARFWNTLHTIDRRLLIPAVLFAIGFYRVAFSWFFSGSCRFVPSCSAYAHEAVVRHGVVIGSWMAFGRLARCQPLHPGGFDPVR